MTRRDPFPDLKAVRERAVKLLAQREHSARELRDKLVRRGAPPVWVDSAIAQLQELGLQNDQRALQELARHYLQKGGSGPRKIAHQLRQRGFDEADIRALLDERRDDEAERDRVRALVERREPDAAEEGLDARQRARLLRFLAGRGFGAGAARDVLRSYPWRRAED